METVLYVLAASGYALAFGSIIHSLKQNHSNIYCVRFGTLAAVVAHLAAITCRWRSGISFELVDLFAVIALLVVLVICLAAKGRQNSNSGLIALPVAWLSILFLACVSPIAVKSMSLELALHVLLSICGYALLTIAALQAVMIWYKQKLLKQHQVSGILSWLAPLDEMEQGLIRSVLASALLIGLALISGVLFIIDWHTAGVMHKTALAALSWAVLVMLIVGRWRFGWRGAAAAKAVLAAYALLLLAYFGSKLVLILLQR